MPRIRTLKPELFMSPQVMNLSHAARLLFVGQILQADDEGRGIADPRKFKAVIFGGDDDITAARVLELLMEVESQVLCVTYDGGAHGRLYALPTWRDHQYVPKPRKSNYPPPPKAVAPEHSRNGTGGLPEPSGTATGGSEGSDRKDRIGSGTRARAVINAPVDNSTRRARASDGLKKPAESDPEEIERRRREAAEIATSLAAKASA